MADVSSKPTALERLGGWLRRHREDARESQVQLSQFIGISQNAVSQIELGIIEKPVMEYLVRYGSRYGIEPNDIAEMAGWWTRPEWSREGLPDDVRPVVGEIMALPREVRGPILSVLRTMVKAARLSEARG